MFWRVLLSCLCICIPSSSWAAYKDCLSLYRSKKYVAAASCFQTFAKKAKRLPKGQALRSAALALNKASKREPNVEKKGHLKTQAVALLLQFEQEKLYRNTYERNSARRIRLQILESIGYASLSIVGGHDKAKIRIKGFKFQAQGTGKWIDNVRPGTYRISVAQPGQKEKSKVVKILPKQPKVITFTAPMTPKVTISTHNVVGWILVTLGAVTAASSITPFVLLGDKNKDIRDEKRIDCPILFGQSCRDKRQAKLNTLQAEAQLLQVLGFGLLGVGVATAIAGVVLVMLPAKKVAVIPLSKRKPKSHSSVVLLRLE